jgi:uncharacterized RDD family membrane protein YckC
VAAVARHDDKTMRYGGALPSDAPKPVKPALVPAAVRSQPPAPKPAPTLKAEPPTPKPVPVAPKPAAIAHPVPAQPAPQPRPDQESTDRIRPSAAQQSRETGRYGAPGPSGRQGDQTLPYGGKKRLDEMISSELSSKIEPEPLAPMPSTTQPMLVPAAEAPTPAGPAIVAPRRSMGVRSAEIPEEQIHAEPGGAFAQLGAGLVDAVILAVLFFTYIYLAQLIAGKVPGSDETGLDWVIDRAIAWRGVLVPGAALLGVLSFVYSSLFHALVGKTLGKRLFGLTVVDATGLPPRLARSALRSLCSFFSAALLMMGFVLVLFDGRKQALHDKLARTFVVRLAG